MMHDLGIARRDARDDATPQARQVAALPWRRDSAGARQVMLVTSRETRRWIMPKGWTIDGLSEAASAAQEAYEEAGVRGWIAPTPIGVFDYDKRLSRGRTKAVRVAVFPLQVVQELDDWPERAERVRGWFTPDHAATLVQEEGLSALLRALD